MPLLLVQLRLRPLHRRLQPGLRRFDPRLELCAGGFLGLGVFHPQLHQFGLPCRRFAQGSLLLHRHPLGAYHDPTQRVHAGVQRRAPGLLHFGHQRHLAGHQFLPDVLEESGTHPEIVQVHPTAEHRAGGEAQAGHHRAAKHPDQRPGQRADGRPQWSLVSGLQDRHPPLLVLGDHCRRIEGQTLLLMQLL